MESVTHEINRRLRFDYSYKPGRLEIKGNPELVEAMFIAMIEWAKMNGAYDTKGD